MVLKEYLANYHGKEAINDTFGMKITILAILTFLFGQLICYMVTHYKITKKKKFQKLDK